MLRPGHVALQPAVALFRQRVPCLSRLELAFLALVRFERRVSVADSVRLANWPVEHFGVRVDQNHPSLMYSEFESSRVVYEPVTHLA